MKRILAYAVLILGLLAVSIPIATSEWQRIQWVRWDPDRLRPEAMQELEEHGLTADLADLLARGPKPDGWLATWVVEAPPDLFVIRSEEDEVILAADPPSLVGKSVTEAKDELRRDGYDRILGMGARVRSLGGKEYSISIMRSGPDPGPTADQAAWAALTVGLLAWLALAAWVWLDARDRGSAAANGWLLLALLTGPVALAVWFISRYTQEGFPPLQRTCPGCGGETPRSSAFCVRCGHALRPACPDCRRPVELDWAYCGTCGAELK